MIANTLSITEFGKLLHIYAKFVCQDKMAMAFLVVYALFCLVVLSVPFLYYKGKQRWLCFGLLLLCGAALSALVGKIVMAKAYAWYYTFYLT